MSKYKVGAEYECLNGQIVTVVKRTSLLGYECVEGSDGRYRYDRSTSSSDAGRVTGTDHDYSFPYNFKRH